MGTKYVHSRYKIMINEHVVFVNGNYDEISSSTIIYHMTNIR